MIREADTQAAGNPPKSKGKQKICPREKEKGGNCADVERHHEKCCDLADGLSKSSIALKYAHECPENPHCSLDLKLSGQA
jgi:hypothetical protein